MTVVWLFLAMPRVCLQFVIVVFSDYAHLLLLLLDTMIFYNQSNVSVALRDHVEQCTVGETRHHTGKCIRRFGGIYAYCRYFIDR